MPYKRILWGAAILLITVALFFSRVISTIIFDVLFGALMVLAALEINNLFKGKDKPTFKWAIMTYPVVVTILVIVCNLTGVVLWQFFLLFTLITALWFIGFLTLPYVFKGHALKGYRSYSTQMSFSAFIWQSSKHSMMACFYPTILLMFMLLINHFNEWGIVAERTLIAEPNVALFGLLMVFCISMVSDTTAYVLGTAFKTPKISMEKLGKGKSYGGVAFGVLGGAIAAVSLYFILMLFSDFQLMFEEYTFPFYLAIIAGLCGGVFNMMGDLFSSFIKRKAGVKDFSNLIPGHGGIMDRLNGIALNCVFVFIFLLVVFA